MIDELTENNEQPKNSSYYLSRMLMLFSLFFLGNILSILGGAKAASMIYHIPIQLEHIDKFFSHPGSPDAIIFIQNIYTILAFGLTGLVFLQYYAKEKMYEVMGFEKQKNVYIALFLILISAICIVPFIDILSDLNKQIPGMQTDANREDSLQKMLNIFLSGTSAADLVLNLLSVALIPAICEELFFRASFQNLVKDWSKSLPIAILASSIIFSFIHGDLSGFIPRVAAGIVLGIIYGLTKNIGLSILFHFIFNSFSVVAKWFENRGTLIIEENQSWPIYIVIPTFVILSGCLYILFIQFKKSNHGVE